MSNISSIIAGHNKLLLQPKVTEYECNYSIKNPCLLQNQWQIPNLMFGNDKQNKNSTTGNIAKTLSCRNIYGH